jgi:uncharacterized coiled-coil protein SlyX
MNYLSNDIEYFRKRCQELMIENITLRLRLGEAPQGEPLLTTVPELQARIIVLQDQCNQLRARIFAQDDRITAQDETIAALGQRITAQDETIAALGQRITALDQIITTQGQTIASITAACNKNMEDMYIRQVVKSCEERLLSEVDFKTWSLWRVHCAAFPELVPASEQGAGKAMKANAAQMTASQKVEYINILRTYFGDAVGSNAGEFSTNLTNYIWQKSQAGILPGHPKINAEFPVERLRAFQVPDGVNEMLFWAQFFERCEQLAATLVPVDVLEVGRPNPGDNREMVSKDQPEGWIWLEAKPLGHN